MSLDTTTLYIDFEVIKTNSCKALKILDESNWASGYNDVSYISITPPGLTTPVVHVFQKGKVNIFNAVNLGMTDVTDYSTLPPLPDGVYTLVVHQCENDPYEKKVYHLQDCQIRCKIARKLISVDLICTPCRKELLKEIQDIVLFLDAAQAHTNRCNVNKAMEYYQRASLLLERISEQGESPCTSC